MARSSLSNSHRKLNLSHRKTIWLQNTVKVGNKMADVLCQKKPSLGVDPVLLGEEWKKLMVELVEMML